MSDSKRPGLTYRDAGVDIDAQDEGLRRIKEMLHATRTPGVLADLGSFGGMFRPDLTGMAEPVLVASCDGVGTKLKVAHMAGIHNTIGRDLVNHCVNDILVQGATPAVLPRLPRDREALARSHGADRRGGRRGMQGERLRAPRAARPRRCRASTGRGSTTSPGSSSGSWTRGRPLTGSAIRVGDVLVGLPSAGLHTNGYSLARKIFFEVAGKGVTIVWRGFR
jgi:phosphoribosylformylglycinamidine cyclo-ligase